MNSVVRISASSASKADVEAACAVRRAAESFPRARVERANRTRVSVQHLPPTPGLAGDYHRVLPQPRTLQTPGRPDYPVPAGRAIARTGPGPVALHEYVHHFQDALPELDRQFRRLHVRRTTRPDGTRDPIEPLTGYTGVGREDQYIDAYFGREYSDPVWPEGPLEVMTRTYETIFTGAAKNGVWRLMENDPEILDFALGALFRFDPR